MPRIAFLAIALILSAPVQADITGTASVILPHRQSVMVNLFADLRHLFSAATKTPREHCATRGELGGGRIPRGDRGNSIGMLYCVHCTVLYYIYCTDLIAIYCRAARD